MSSCGGNRDGPEEDTTKGEAPGAEAKADDGAAKAPGAEDMTAAKMLYVKLKAKWDSGVEGCPTSVDELKGALAGGMAKDWAAIDGLRHKYFLWNGDTETCSGVYVFFNQEKLDAYMASDLFASHEKMPHFSSVEAQPIDVMSGTELSIEKTAWANTPPTADDVGKAVMLIVELKMKYDTGVEGLPTNEGDLRGFMTAPPAGMGYPATFGGLGGLRGKYFGYKTEGDMCYGFYTFTDRASLDTYMASELFTKQGEPPHIDELTYTIHEVMLGTELTMDLGAWTGN